MADGAEDGAVDGAADNVVGELESISVMDPALTGGLVIISPPPPPPVLEDGDDDGDDDGTMVELPIVVDVGAADVISSLPPLALLGALEDVSVLLMDGLMDGASIADDVGLADAANVGPSVAPSTVGSLEGAVDG